MATNDDSHSDDSGVDTKIPSTIFSSIPSDSSSSIRAQWAKCLTNLPDYFDDTSSSRLQECKEMEIQLKLSRKTNLVERRRRGRLTEFKLCVDKRNLRTAAQTCNIDLVKCLLEKGTDPNCPDCLSRTPLHLASCRGYSQIVKELLKYGAKPNVTDSLNNTPLHLAAISTNSKEYNETIKSLLNYGADIRRLDRNGKTALQLVMSKFELMKNRYKSNQTEEINGIIECLMETLIIFANEEKKRNDTADLSSLTELMCKLSATETDKPVYNEMMSTDDV